MKLALAVRVRPSYIPASKKKTIWEPKKDERHPAAGLQTDQKRIFYE
jgi:hypothetical protein